MLTVVKASAGSGKTYTLVREYLRLALRHPTEHFKHILAITFTNKAANEMKVRILEALEKLTELNEKEAALIDFLTGALGIDNETLRKRSQAMLSAILHNYTDLAISTIDSFTHNVIRGFAYELKLNMNVEIEMDTPSLMAEVIDLLLDEIEEEKSTEDEVKRKYLSKALIEFASTKLQEGKGMKIEEELLKFSFLLLKDDTYFHREALSNTSIPQLLQVQQKLYELTNQFEQRINKLVAQAFDIIDANGIVQDDFKYKSTGLISYFKGLRDNGLAYDNYLGGKRHWDIYNSGKWWSVNQPTTAMLDAQEALDKLFVQLTSMFSNEMKEIILAKLIRENIFPFMLLQAINDVLQQYKLENGLMLIGEFQQMVFGEVKGQPVPVIFERVGARYDNIMIDEFQDTSVMQWHNLLPLIDNAVANMNECLIVGDAKQAIYRFRGGEVKQFAMLPKIYGSDDDWVLKEREINIANHHPKLENLAYNFRSRNNIIAFNNELYDTVNLLPDLADKSIYLDHAQQPGKNIPGGNVQITFIEKTEEQSLIDVMLEKVKAAVEDILSRGFDKRDIAILTEKNSVGARIASYLIDKGYDVISPESLFITESPAVQLLESALGFLHRPDNLIARAELLYLLNERFQKQALHHQFEVKGPVSEFESLISSMAGRKFEPQLLRQNNLFGMVHALIHVFRLDAITDPFIQFFLDEVLLYTHKFTGTIQHFIEWWEKEKESKSIIYPDTLDAIRVMTVHKSKGLEFPVVILPDANYKVQIKDAQTWVNIDKPYAEGITDFILPLKKKLLETDYAHLYEQEQQAYFLDRLNLLYVATTRPAEMLYIIAEKPSDNKKKSTEGFTSMNMVLHHYLQHTGKYKDDDETITIFEDQTQKSIFKKANDVNLFTVKPQAQSAASRQIAIRTNKRNYWGKSKLDDIAYGNLLHDLLASIQYQDDANEKMTAYLNAYVQEEKLQQQLMHDAQAVISHPKLAPFFRQPYRIFSERQLLVKGQLKQPDRVLLHPESKHISIIEYKTGQAESKHKTQVTEYAEAFASLGFTVDHTLIVYTTDLSIHQY